MKKSVTFIVFSFLLTSFVIAQPCIPDVSITQTGMYPDSATGLPHAVVGIPYSTVIQLKVLTDTTIIIFGNPVPATVDSIIINGVTGFPSGFSYLCNPTSCHFLADSNACILLQGNAPTLPMVGIHPLSVNVTAYGKIGGSPAPPYPYTVNSYNITVDQNTGIAGLSLNRFDMTQNFPNPFNKTTEISFTSVKNDFVVFKVMNLIGKIVYSRSIMAQKGLNEVVLSAKDFDPGIYIYSISNSKSSITRRMIVLNN